MKTGNWLKMSETGLIIIAGYYYSWIFQIPIRKLQDRARR